MMVAATAGDAGTAVVVMDQMGQLVGPSRLLTSLARLVAMSAGH